MIKARWFLLSDELQLDTAGRETAWQQLDQAYGHKNRHYHNFQHLEAMLTGLEQWQNGWEDLQAVKLAIWYHDFVYQSTRKDNEQKSADFAQKIMHGWGLPKKQIETVHGLILSTAGHQPRISSLDCLRFLDLDLAILASDASVYLAYTKSIRKEYTMVPGFMYRKGRRQVLQNFLKRPYLYFTEEMRRKCERKARENIEAELQRL